MRDMFVSIARYAGRYKLTVFLLFGGLILESL